MSASSNNSRPLTISIIGAGIGGLTAAVALRRNDKELQMKLLAYDPIQAAQQFYQERFGGVN
ncbi:hypothetical protein FB45DRAFT_1030805 [Roridomyces roridus]|uniref:Uncharacterized protein n=1 Tax=Roridomyces roridus TaxID=1738132 RepID=A0AAD7FHQ0_9AGAR|nr:hypothetical protein FB45DRAFT_1030805 [Roridomyces roridus]